MATHCCLEPHGTVIQGQGENVQAWPSTQFVTGWAGNLATNRKIPAANIKVQMDYIGGGFGSKFNPDAWAIVGAELSKKAGGRPADLLAALLAEPAIDQVIHRRVAGGEPSSYVVAGKAGRAIVTLENGSVGYRVEGEDPFGYPPLPPRMSATEVHISGSCWINGLSLPISTIKARLAASSIPS